MFMNIKSREAFCYGCDESIYMMSSMGSDEASSEGKTPKDPTDDLFVRLTEILAPPMPKRDDSAEADPPPARDLPPKFTPGLCGLQNLGNTCYMNSALQCLSNSPPLVDYFLECEPLYVAKTHRFIEDFANLFRVMWSGQRNYVAPRNVASDVFTVNPLFRGYGQQDSQECLRTILDNLHERLKEEDFEAEKRWEIEEEKRKKAEEQETPTKTPEETQKPSRPPPKRRFYKSIISSIFEGKLLSRVQCLSCGHTSDTFDGFYDLSVSIPSDKLSDKIKRRQQSLAASGLSGPASSMATSKRGGVFSSLFSLVSKRTVDLYDCLHGFCATDELTGKDRYRCEKCKKLSDATKTFTVAQPPPMLCIQIKRFKHDAYFSSKISDHVNFPLDGLDMTPFCITSDPLKNGDDPFDNAERRKKLKEDPVTYDLCGIVNHMGSLSGGHYIAYCRNKLTNRWYCFNDDHVAEVSADEVKSAEAYLLFYSRRPSGERQQEIEAIETAIETDDRSDSRLVSKLWMQMWRTTENPGPISHVGLVCKHGLLKRDAFDRLRSLVEKIPRKAFDRLSAKYGCEGDDLSSLKACDACMNPEQLARRRKREIEAIERLDRTHIGPNEPWFMIDRQWLDSWLQFAHKSTRDEPPGPITNHELFEADGVTVKPSLTRKVHYRGLCQDVWEYFVKTYGGGPPIARTELDIYSKPFPLPETKPPADEADSGKDESARKSN